MSILASIAKSGIAHSWVCSTLKVFEVYTQSIFENGRNFAGPCNSVYRTLFYINNSSFYKVMKYKISRFIGWLRFYFQYTEIRMNSESSQDILMIYWKPNISGWSKQNLLMLWITWLLSQFILLIFRYFLLDNIIHPEHLRFVWGGLRVIRLHKICWLNLIKVSRIAQINGWVSSGLTILKWVSF